MPKAEKKSVKKDKDKEKEKEKLAEEEAKREQERQEAQQRIHVLQHSGILDAYEYFLRAICKNGLPEANIFEFAAQQILKYQKKIKQKQLSKSPDRESPLKNQRKTQKAEKLPKPSLLPFKGQVKEEVLKALKK